MYEFLDWRVQDVMSQPVTVTADATLGQAEEILEKHGFNAVPVVDDAQRLLGVVSTLDLLRAFDFAEDVILPQFDQVMKRPVSSVLTRDVDTVCPGTGFFESGRAAECAAAAGSTGSGRHRARPTGPIP
jgi:CBS domain-containing protein